jgi:thiol:disulfide interchange protein DsbA
MHARAFHASQGERNRLAKDEDIFAWVGKQGVDVAKFKEVYNSFTVSNQVRKATQLQQEYEVEGVPAMGVAGRYYTDGTKAGNMANVLRVVDQLIAASRKG